MGGATLAAVSGRVCRLISIHAPHAGSDYALRRCGNILVISIHAPHAGSDANRPVAREQHRYFNPRSPCGERRSGDCSRCRRTDFNPRSPCGERHNDKRMASFRGNISIHAPHAGSDMGRGTVEIIEIGFQSTLPMRGATEIFRRDEHH